MKKIILAAMSAGILSGCSSAPPLATPKGEFVDMNTDITSLLPHSEPVYTGAKIANVTSPSLVITGAKTGNKNVLVSGNSEADKKVVPHSGLLQTAKPIDKTNIQDLPASLKGFDTPVVTVAANTTRKSNAVEKVKSTSTIPDVGKNPFRGSEPVKPLTADDHKSVVPVSPVKTIPVMKVWKIKKGTTLINGFTEWMAKEKCPSGNGEWKLQRLTDTDYPIDYTLTFTGKNFEDVTTQLFDLYRRSQAPLYVSGYRNQCLIVISDKK
ncbi:pilus assembly protein PilL [Citrobacter sp. NCU1]|uniref:TcpQ domain-containing protein n=1 Tax=Citrobacter sp. NCU1 TaxID=2026683 RepID=UPI00139138D6|nr:TcpQ domain-containing protein [Citrobacter sp. NCU1]NDO82804.1 pilus assembly protein PilL [Citrobacter sp. NCU1]